MLSIRWKRALAVLATLTMICALVAVSLAGSAVGKAQATDGSGKLFTILHTNDEHSEVIPYNLAMDYPGNPTTGGFSRLAKAITDVKTAKAAAGEPVLTFGSGDWSQGTLFSWLETAAAPEISLMQQMDYDAVTIGNHDIELGPEYLAGELAKARAAGVNLPVLSSNITFSDTSSKDDTLKSFYSSTDKQRSNLYIQPYTTKTLSNGIKVGMFGLLGVEAELVAPGEAPLSFGNVVGDPQDPISFVNRVVKAQSTVDTLRSTEHCDVVVCLSHMGTYEERQLAKFVPSIDVIVGGHSHDLNYPPIIEGSGNTIIVQAKANTEYLGDLELQYDPSVTKGPKVTVRNATAIRMDQSVGNVPAIDAVINSYMAGINAHLAAGLGKPGFNCLAPFAETDMNNDGGFPLKDGPPMRETNLGDLITDTYKSTVNHIDPAHPTPIALEANGLIRAGLAKGATGVFSFYDLYRTFPLGGNPYALPAPTPGYPLVSFYLVGAEIQGVMEQLLVMNRNDFFIQMSGMKYTYDPNAASGHKVLSVTVDNGAGGWDPIKPGSLYKLATDYYTGSFLSLFGLYPRGQNGAQHKPPTYPDPMKDFIVPTAAAGLAAWQALYGTVAAMPDLDGDKLPNIPPSYSAKQGRITRLATAFYFAEGTCRPGFDPYFCIQNPGGTDASVKITYMKGDTNSDTQTLTVAKNSRSTVAVKDKLGEGNDTAHDFSAKVESTNSQQIIVERPMYFNYRPGDKNWNGGSDAVGAFSPATNFYFAEGTCRPGFETYFTIQNPGSEDASVNITYMKGDGTTDTQAVTVIKYSRNTIRVKDRLGEGDDAAHDFSTKLESMDGVGTYAQPIIAERPMYFNYKGVWTGGHDVVGALSPDTAFYFAEGTCRPGFDPYICIQNTDSAEAPVKITYMKGDGTTDSQTLTVAKHSRSTVVVKDKLGEGNDAAHDFSAKVESVNGVPIIAERPMYFNYKGVWTGGHDVVGALSPDTDFYFAEGTCRPGFDPYFCIQNPGGKDASVKITYMKGDGTTDTQTLTVAKNSRSTVVVKDKLGEGDDTAHDFSAKVESTNSQEIIAERPMYFNYSGGWTGGSCVVGCVP